MNAMRGVRFIYYFAMDTLQQVSQVPAEVEQVVPPEFSFPAPVSASKAILKDYYVEYYPSSQESFSYTDNDIIDVDFSDNLASIDLKDTYFKFILELENVHDGATQNTFSAVSFDIGGASSLFRNVYLSTKNGDHHFLENSEHHRIEVMRSVLYGSRESVEDLDGLRCDALSDQQLARSAYPTVYGNCLKMQHWDGAAWVNVTTTISLANRCIAVNSLMPVFIGDTICQYAAADNTAAPAYVGEVINVTRGANAQTTALQMRHIVGIPTAGGADAQQLFIYRTGGGGTPSNKSMSIATTSRISSEFTSTANEYEVILKVNDPICDMLLPMFIVNGGLRWRFQLEHPKRAFMCNEAQLLGGMSLLDTFSYKIKNFRMVARIVQLHPNIRTAIRNTFNTNRGIQIPTNQFQINPVTTTGNAGTETLTITPGKRSVRALIAQIQDTTLADGTGNATFTAPSLSHGLRDGITEMYIRIGAMRFPERELQINEQGNELFEHMLMHRRRWIDAKQSLRFQKELWHPTHAYHPTNSLTDVVFDSRLCYYVFDTSRCGGELGWLTGIDTTQTGIQIHIKREGVYSNHQNSGKYNGSTTSFTGNCRYRFYVLFDKLLTVSKNGVVSSE